MAMCLLERQGQLPLGPGVEQINGRVGNGRFARKSLGKTDEPKRKVRIRNPHLNDRSGPCGTEGAVECPRGLRLRKIAPVEPPKLMERRHCGFPPADSSIFKR